MEHLAKLITLALTTGTRGRHLTTAIFTVNKVAFRDTVLANCTGSLSSKEILRGTCLASPQLFGAVPESLIAKISASHEAAKVHMLRPKKSFSVTSTTAYKRNLDAAFTNAGSNKKPKLSNFNYASPYQRPSTSNYNHNNFSNNDRNVQNRSNYYNNRPNQSSSQGKTSNSHFPRAQGRGRKK